MPRTIPTMMLLCIVLVRFAIAQTGESLPVSAPLMTDAAGNTGKVAFSSVWRVICQSAGRIGTGSGFLHESAKMITAAHVVRGCKAANLVLVGASGQRVAVTDMRVDDDLDLAILTPASAIPSSALSLNLEDESPVGIQVIAWGFPGGYRGFSPLLSVGYLAGVDMVKRESGKVVRQIVVNAAFNGGNSGGPVVNVQDGTVIGVVSSKLAPLPSNIESALSALEKQEAGFTYTAKKADGTEIEVSEGQVVAAVLQYLRSQTQLVIGYAVPVNDLREFLKKNGISP